MSDRTFAPLQPALTPMRTFAPVFSVDAQTGQQTQLAEQQSPQLNSLIGNQAMQQLASNSSEPNNAESSQDTDVVDDAETVDAAEATDTGPQADIPPSIDSEEDDLTSDTESPIAAESLTSGEATGASEDITASASPPTSMSDLQSQVENAAASIPTPTLGDFTSAQTAIRRHGFAMATARRGSVQSSATAASQRGGGAGGIDDRSSTARPAEFDPVPEATAAVVAHSNQTLTTVTPPAVVNTPLGNVPEIGQSAIAADDLQIVLSLNPGETPAGLDAEQRAAFELERPRLDALRARLRGEHSPAPEPQVGTTPQPVFGIAPIEDHGAPPPVDYSHPSHGQVDLGQVFARIMLQGDTVARGIVKTTRDAIVLDNRPVGAVVSVIYDTLGESEYLGQVRSVLETRVQELARDAGVTEEKLNELIAARRVEVDSHRQSVAESCQSTAAETSAVLTTQGAQSASVISSVVENAEATSQSITESANSVTFGSDIEARRDILLSNVTKVVTEQVTQYRQQGDIRRAVLDRAKRSQADAYVAAVQRDTYAITERSKVNGRPVMTPAVLAELHTSETWQVDQLARLDRVFAELRARADTEVTAYQTAIRDAGEQKRVAIRDWADGELQVCRSEEDRVRERAQDQADQQEQEARAWAAVENQRTTAAISNDLGQIQDFEADVRAGLDRNAIIQNRSLSTSQIAILDAYLTPEFEGESTESRAINAVAFAARAKLAHEQSAQLMPQLAQLVMNKPDADWPMLNTIAAAQGGNFNASEIAGKVRRAVNRVGTDEDAIFSALANLTSFQSKVLRATYAAVHGDTLDEDLDGDLSGRELQRAKALLDAKQDEADAIGLRQAMHGNYEGSWYNIGGITGADTDTIHSITRGRDPARAGALETAYREISPTGSNTLSEDVHAEVTNPRDRERFDAELSGNFALADAIELRGVLPTPETIRLAREQNSGMPIVADRERIQRIYERVRTELTTRAAREGWTTARLEAEIAQRNRGIETEFNSRYGADYENPEHGALRGAFATGFQWRPEEQNLVEGLADNDLARVDAAKISIEDRGVYADDRVQNEIINAQYRRSLESMQRDEMPVRRMILARQLTEREQHDAHRPWSSARFMEERDRLQRQVDRTLEQAARAQGEGNLNALRDAYRRDYGGSLDATVLSNTQGYGNTQAQRLLSQGGYLTPAQEVYFAIRGSGTNEDSLRRALEGRTAAELAEMRVEFAELARNETGVQSAFSHAYAYVAGDDATDMDAEVRGDLSGRAAFDIGQLLRGTPETVEQRRERLHEALEYETNAGILGNSTSQREAAALRRTIDEFDRNVVRLNDPTIPPERREAYIGAYENSIRSVNASIQIHRDSLDSTVEKVTTAIGVIVAIAVGAIVSIFTFGAGGVVLAAVIGSILATAASMATKQLVLGQQYGWEDVATDVAVGIADALVAAATAGIANKILGIGQVGSKASAALVARNAQLMARSGIRGAGARFFLQGAGRAVNASESALARMLPTSTMLSEMVERGGVAKLLATVLVEGGESLVQGSGSAAVGTMLNDATWENGNPLVNIAKGTLQQAAMGALMGMAMKPVQGIASGIGHIRETWRGGADPALHALRQDWDAFRRQHPDVPHLEYLKARSDAGLPSSDLHVSDAQLAVAQEIELARQAAGGGPRSHESELRSVLPETLRDKVPVIVDSTLTGRTVEVRYVKSLGGATEIRIAAGPQARPIDIILHMPTVQAMQRYAGLSGRVVNLIEHLQFWVTRKGMPPFGSKAWEAHYELNKLPTILDERIRSLHSADIDASERANIIRDILHLSERIDAHQATVDRMDIAPGRGYVAADSHVAPVLPSRPAGERADPHAVRYRVNDSPQIKTHGADSVLQVGSSWKEDGRTYRTVEVLNPDGTVHSVREEIRLMENGTETDRWVQRGSESNDTGRIGEDAAWRQTQAAVDASGGSLVLIPSAFIQSGSGAGFDQVAIRFAPDGTATIVIVEVKNYPGRFIPLADFTAIGDNLRTNMETLRELLSNLSKAPELGLTMDQMKAVATALNARRVEIDVLISPSSKLGTEESGSVLKNLAIQAQKVLGSSIPVTRRTIDEAHMQTAKEQLATADHIGSRPHFYELAGNKPANFTDDGIRLAQAAIVAERGGAGLIDIPLHSTKQSGTFVDQQGNHFVTVDAGTPGRSGPKSEKALLGTANELISQLSATVTKPHNATESTKILVNVTDLTGPQRETLLRHLVDAAKKRGDQNMLRRLVLIDVRRGTVDAVAVPVKALKKSQ